MNKIKIKLALLLFMITLAACAQRTQKLNNPVLSEKTIPLVIDSQPGDSIIAFNTSGLLVKFPPPQSTFKKIDQVTGSGYVNGNETAYSNFYFGNVPTINQGSNVVFSNSAIFSEGSNTITTPANTGLSSLYVFGESNNINGRGGAMSLVGGYSNSLLPGDSNQISQTLVFGRGNTAYSNGNPMAVLGYGNTARNAGEFSAGINGTDSPFSSTTGRIFNIGNGSSGSDKTDLISGFRDGKLIAPSLTIANIDSNRSLVTKEYVDSIGSSAAPTYQTLSQEKDGSLRDIVKLTNGSQVDLGDIVNYYSAEQQDQFIGNPGDILDDLNKDEGFMKMSTGKFKQITNDTLASNLKMADGTSVEDAINERVEISKLGTINGQSIYGNNIVIEGGSVAGTQQQIISLTTSATVTSDRLTASVSGDTLQDFKIATISGGESFSKNADSTLQWNRSQSARIDYNDSGIPAFLVEDGSTNLALYSNDFSTGGGKWWSNGITVSVDDATAPYGGLIADRIVTTNVNEEHFKLAPPISAVLGETYTFSIFFKQVGSNYRMQLAGMTGLFGLNVWANFNIDSNVRTVAPLAQGADVLSSTVEYYANGWVRVSITANTVDTLTESPFGISFVDSDTSAKSTSFLGVSSQYQTYVWGAQIENGGRPSSPIQTTTAVATRYADSITLGYPSSYGTSDISLIRETVDGITSDITAIPQTYRLPFGRVEKVEIFTGSGTAGGGSYTYKPSSTTITGSRNLYLSDVGNIVEATEDLTYTINKDFTPMKKDDVVDLEAHNGTTLTVRAQPGVTLNYTDGGIVKLESALKSVSLSRLRKRATNEYIVTSTGSIASTVPDSTATVTVISDTITNLYKYVLGDFGIVQGVVSDAVALANRDSLENALYNVQALGYDGLLMDDFDGYFNTSTITGGRPSYYTWVEAINIPGNFDLVLTSGATLRVQPNNAPRYALFTMYKVANSTISGGGSLIGDRLDHTPSGTGSDEWGHLLDIDSSQDIVIDGLNISYANGDAISIHAREFTYQSGYRPSKNVVIKNNRLTNNRRQGISLTDGQYIYIDNNTIDKIGLDIANNSGGISYGTHPKYGIDLEPYRRRDSLTNELIEYEHIDHVWVTNNTLSNNAYGDLIVKAVSDYVVTGNTMATGMSYHHSSNGIVEDNRFVRPDGTDAGNRIAIAAGSTSEYCFNNTVRNNYIENFNVGISVTGEGNTIEDNTIINSQGSGIRLIYPRNSTISGNTATSDVYASYGLYAKSSSGYNTTISNNTFTSDRAALAMADFKNLDTIGKSLILTGNTFKSSGKMTIDRVADLDISTGNMFEGPVEVQSSSNISISASTFTSTSTYAINLLTANVDIVITGNTMTANSTPLKITETPTGTFTNTGNTYNGTTQ